MKKRIALIPAYKPNIQLLEFVKGIEEHGMDCLIVNDGSGEEYLSLFHKIERETEARVLSFLENRGKGAALKGGLEYLQKENAGLQGDFTLITLDADGQHLLKDALNLLSVAEEKKDTLILGSRTQSKDSPLRSRIGNGITKEVFNLCTGVEVKDTQTGMRAFSGKMIPEMLDIPGERYEYEMNVLLFLAKEGVPMEEVPIETVYINDNAESHFDTVKDSYRIYKQILKFSASSLVSFLADFLLYSFFFLITGGLFVSNFLARVISLHINFFLNKTMVFSTDGEKEDIAESKKRMENARVQKGTKWNLSALKSFKKEEYLSYLGLAAFIFLINSFILSGIVGSLGMNPYLAKILTEGLLFCLSYFVQKKWIFEKKNSKKVVADQEELRKLYGATKIEASKAFSGKKDEELATFEEALQEKNSRMIQAQV
ncbi:bifunctional glycosyltransferase family 2/GtrA family protein [Oribacterium sinus]|uniref:bifunctional glycosyltransferase family 2/GtrA family protein n=1 Tax=Oribacterium sinus TaxID=237576 RepID=UPI0028D0A56F|nr:bifunctional glycosyltransferase family 2/GtrA family protein [Oribacterium sinus]